MKNRKVAVLEQYVQADGRRFTYMIEFMGHRDYWGAMPEAIVLFKVYVKDDYLPTQPCKWWQKVLDLGKYNRAYIKYKSWLSKHMISSQLHNAT